MIKPTVGRVVWFIPGKEDSNFALYSAPFAAHICYVYTDNCVNLMVIHPEGRPVPQTSVTLIQEGDERPENGRFCEWMPYQKGQAAKTEVLEAAKAS
jgi:hypothetical protein